MIYCHKTEKARHVDSWNEDEIKVSAKQIDGHGLNGHISIHKKNRESV